MMVQRIDTLVPFVLAVAIALSSIFSQACGAAVVADEEDRIEDCEQREAEVEERHEAGELDNDEARLALDSIRTECAAEHERNLEAIRGS